VDPAPGVVSIPMRPPKAVMAVLTTSRPTPRPDRFVTDAAVEKPGMKRRLSISDGASSASGEIRPLRMAVARMRSRSRPAPSSRTRITTLPD
jgi:hypothetical protein